MNTTSVAAGIAYDQTNSIPPSPSSGRYLRFGTFHLDLQQQELFKDGARIRVQGKVCEALLILLQNPGELVTRETLRAQLWPNDSQINYDANVNTTVNKLRQVLGDSPDRPSFVETIPRKGYAFIASVEPVELPAFAVSTRDEGSVSRKSKENVLESATRFLGAAGASTWFAAGAIALLLAGVLFGAAIMLYAHRAV